MKTSPWLIVVALSLAGATCTPDDPLGPTLDAREETGVFSAPSMEMEVRQSPVAVRVPFQATGEGVGTDPEPGPPRDDGFVPVGNLAHGTGNHLGHFTSVHRQCVDFQTLEFRDGTVTFHGADGDELHATFRGFLSPTGEREQVHGLGGLMEEKRFEGPGPARIPPG